MYIKKSKAKVAIDNELPEDICEHREWGEYVKVSINRSDNSGCDYFVGGSFVHQVETLMEQRASDIGDEIDLEWDYVRFEPKVTRVQQEGIDKDFPEVSFRIYARAYRLKRMSEEKAIEARARITKLIEARELIAGLLEGCG